MNIHAMKHSLKLEVFAGERLNFKEQRFFTPTRHFYNR